MGRRACSGRNKSTTMAVKDKLDFRSCKVAAAQMIAATLCQKEHKQNACTKHYRRLCPFLLSPNPARIICFYEKQLVRGRRLDISIRIPVTPFLKTRVDPCARFGS